MNYRILGRFQSFAVFAAAAIIIITFSSRGYAVEPTLHSAKVDFGVGFGDQHCENNSNGSISDCQSDTDETYPVFEGHARGNVPLGRSGAAIQLDVGGFAYFTDRSDQGGEENLHNNFYGGAHLAYRNPASYAAGVFGSFGSTEGGDDDDATYWMIGIEGQKYFDELTLYGQVGYFDADDENNDDVIHDAVFFGGVLRYFFGENTMLSAEFSYADGDEAVDSPEPLSTGVIDDIHAFSWGIRGEHALANGPIAMFLDYHGTDIENDRNDGGNESQLSEHVFLVGLRFTFGVKSLKHQDRYGATFDQPDIGRWIGWTLEQVDD